jgi:hypothetical protein
MKRIYEIPRALDIAISTLSGQKVKPLGLCYNGSQPTVANCSNGTSVTQPGSFCSPNGIAPSYGNCNTGTTVVSGCEAGSLPTF